MTVFVATLMAIPSAIVLGLMLGLVGLVIGGGQPGGTVTFWSILISFPALTYLFIRGAGRPRNSFRRGLMSLSLESFSLPLVALIFTAIVGGRSIAQQSSSAAVAGAAIGIGLAGVALLALGIALAIAVGGPCLILYFVIKPAPAARQADAAQ